MVSAVVPSAQAAVQKAVETRAYLSSMDILLKEGTDGVRAAEQIRGRFNITNNFRQTY